MPMALKKISAEDYVKQQDAIVHGYRTAPPEDRKKAWERAHQQLTQLGIAPGHAEALLRGKR